MTRRLQVKNLSTPRFEPDQSDTRSLYKRRLLLLTLEAYFPATQSVQLE